MAPPKDRLVARSRGIYCTIVAQNYLPQSLVLYDSIRKEEPSRLFVILVVDGNRKELETGRPNLVVVDTTILGLTDREVLDLATIYDVVEFSTAVKPLFLKYLLELDEQAIYLDPDTYVVSPLAELEALIDQHHIVLTPHLLAPIQPGKTFQSEINTLTVGVHNLGFCAVGRGALPFLDWWWSHLERECLIYPLLGLFVDQKWTDIGAVMFHAFSFGHYGYNIGHWNLHERRIEETQGRRLVVPSNDQVRLFHFSGFDPSDPESISVRQNISLKDKGLGSAALTKLSQEYAALLIDARKELGVSPSYPFTRDLQGKKLSKRLRKTFRKDLLTDDSPPPSPFESADIEAFAGWRRSSVGRRAGSAFADAALGFKYSFPDAYSAIKSAAPRQFSWMRKHLLGQARIRR